MSSQTNQTQTQSQNQTQSHGQAQNEVWKSEARIQMHLHARKRKRKHPSTSASMLSGSSSSSSEEDDEDLGSYSRERQDSRGASRHMQQPEGWRVKLYRLNADGSWDDCGTGRIVCLYKQSANPSTSEAAPQEQLYQELGEPTLCMQAEASPPRVLLRTKILLRDAYQRQGDNIITWCEPYFEDSAASQQQEGQPQGVDLALSFQDNAGCLDIWRQITQVQSRAAEWFKCRGVPQKTNSTVTPTTTEPSTPSVTDMAQAVAAAHHASLQRQQQHAMWVNVASEAQHHFQHSIDDDDDPADFRDQDAEAAAVSMAAAAAAAYGSKGTELPHPPTLQNLEEIADLIAAAQPLPQRESLAVFISNNDCAYLKDLLQLFDPAEARQDYGALATLAACIKTILLLNDPSIIECIVNGEKIYEQVCSTLEYDPDLRDKANHRWFLRERAKFRTVIFMEDEGLVSTIHRCFRVTYLRDTLLRPTMDESTLSTLASLQTFAHADIVKRVMTPLTNATVKGDSYLVLVMRLLGKEVRAINELEWNQLESDDEKPPRADSPQTEVVPIGNKSWDQYLAPQDASLPSRKIRRRGCSSFFRELFNMARMSLQQNDKDDFYAAIVCMEIDLDPQEADQTPEIGNQGSGGSSRSRDSANNPLTSNLLSLLGAILSDPTADVTEKGSILEIIGAIAMYDPSHIRRHSLEYHEILKRNTNKNLGEAHGRPMPNEKKQIVFKCPPNDVIASLLFLLAVETDAGLLLQTTEIMRIILDTDMLGDHGQMGSGLNVDDPECIPSGGAANVSMGNANCSIGSSAAPLESDQNQFLSLFYEHFVQWLVAPFQYTILRPALRIPDSVLQSSPPDAKLEKMMQIFRRGVTCDDSMLRIVPEDAIRGSFAVELLSFCVRAHLYRMKFFLLRSRVLGSVLKLLHPKESNQAGVRCLKLAALRLLRSILSAKDEFYHRHIIQHNLFAPVFEAFRANPVGDNLVSSAIVEMCDFIQNQNTKSLIEYIVTKHLSSEPGPETKSLEDVATPYVSTLTTLRKAYEENLNSANYAQTSVNGKLDGREDTDTLNGNNEQTRYFNDFQIRNPRHGMNEKALEDQRKFRQADAEESYFEADDEEEASNGNGILGTGLPSSSVGMVDRKGSPSLLKVAHLKEVPKNA